jgi:cytochrome c oxidase subunit 2
MRIDSRRLIGGVALAMGAGVAAAQSKYNFQPPVTRVAADIYDLHIVMMWIIAVIFVGVFGVMFYSVWKHRKSLGHKPAQFHENTTLEIVWTIIPFVILVAMAWPATKVILTMKDTSNPDLTIKATGHQWKWGYDYLKGDGEGISFLSNLKTPRDQIEGNAPKGEHYLLEVDNELVVPVNRKVRILTTANDVIHSFWVPAFGIKQDGIPGFVRDTWFRAEKEGTYRGQCAELCGKDHGFMPIVVRVVSESEYKTWVADKKKAMAAAADDPNKQWTLADLVERGASVYAGSGGCVACHQANGAGIPGTFPALTGSKVATGPKDGQINTLLNGVVKDGKPTAMASFKHLSDTDIAAVITYTRNALGNSVGDLVQPSEVKTARK